MRKRPELTIKPPINGHAEVQLPHNGGKFCLE